MNLTVIPSCLQKALPAYTAWTASRWVAPLADLQTPRLDHKIVMGYGLVGEACEVSDVVLNWLESGARPLTDLVKELGDVFFYWARLCEETGYVMTDPPGFVVCASPSEPPVASALRLAKYAGQVSEVMKKYVRDGAFSEPKFQKAMYGVYLSWHELCAAAGLSWHEVLQHNFDKVEGRVSRGTQRGSGDYR